MTDAPYQPPLTRWRQAWRYAAMLLTSTVSLAGMIAVSAGGGDSPGIAPPWWLVVGDVVLGVLAFALTHFRRRWPFAVAVATAALNAVSSFATGPAMLATISLATRRVWRQLVTVGLVAVVGSEVWTVVNPGVPDQRWWVQMGVSAVFTALLISWGMYVGSRRELIWTLRHRAERAEAEQELRAARARANERTRIAREMHDVLAHRISKISMQTGALAFREDLDAPRLRTGLAEVQEQANAALVELRGVLGVLRDDSGEIVERPQPTLADVRTLVAEAAEGGQKVTLEERLGSEVPASLGRTVYRIVQEGLTNAAKHAPSVSVRVLLDGEPGGDLRVRVSNPLGFGAPSAPGSGLGLVGLAERAALAGGRLTHGTQEDRFVLEAWLPWSI